MNIVQFWLVDTIVKHKSINKSIRLMGDEEIADDMLISDGEYTPTAAAAAEGDDLFFDESDMEDAASVKVGKNGHASATKAQLHRSLSNTSVVSDDSLYELRTSNGGGGGKASKK